MKTSLIVIGSSALSAFVAYNVGQYRQYRKDKQVFSKAADTMLAVFETRGNLQALQDIVTTFKMDLEEF